MFLGFKPAAGCWSNLADCSIRFVVRLRLCFLTLYFIKLLRISKLEQNNQNAGIDDNYNAPSPIVQVNVECNGVSYVINIPKIEVPRVATILKKREYALPENIDATKPMVFLDAGANVGVFAIYAKTLNPDNIVHCFEPAPLALDLLRKNVKGLPGIYVHPLGLSNADAEAVMNVHPYNTGENSVMFKFKNEDKNTVINDTVNVQLRDAAKHIDKMGLKHVDVLKIDTEGCEVIILESLERKLDIIDYIMLEYHSEKDRRRIDDILKDFHVYGSITNGLANGVVRYMNGRLVK